jgi:hypothetical protein
MFDRTPLMIPAPKGRKDFTNRVRRRPLLSTFNVPQEAPRLIEVPEYLAC